MNKECDFGFRWMLAAGIYNILWGSWVVLFPLHMFDLFGMDAPRYPEIWQCVGMIVGVYGVGYIIAASNTNRHWPIVLVGFLGKVFGPIGFAGALYQGVFPLSFGITIIFNDLIWWIPFYLILRNAYRANQAEHVVQHLSDADLIDVLEQHRIDVSGKLLLISLRHTGCTFTRDLLMKLSKMEIPQDVRLHFIHMSAQDDFEQFMKKYPADYKWTATSNPDASLYRSQGLPRGNIMQLFGIKEWIRGIKAFMKGAGLGPLRGDGQQLGGMLAISNKTLLKRFQSKSAGDPFPIDTFLNLLDSLSK